MGVARLAGGRLSLVLVLVRGRGQGAGGTDQISRPAQAVLGTLHLGGQGRRAQPGSQSYYHFPCHFRCPQTPLLWRRASECTVAREVCSGTLGVKTTIGCSDAEGGRAHRGPWGIGLAACNLGLQVNRGKQAQEGCAADTPRAGPDSRPFMCWTLGSPCLSGCVSLGSSRNLSVL